MKHGNLFWGVVLITLGALIALRNFDIFYFSWGAIFSLWPLIFVFWGIAVLPVKSGMKVLLTFITIFIGIWILASNPDRGFFRFNFRNHETWYNREYDDDYPWKEQQFNQAYDTATRTAILNFDAAAGDFNLSGTTPQLYAFITEGNTGPYKASANDAGNNTVVIDFSHKAFRGRSKLKNNVEMKLNVNPVWKINVDAGAVDLDMDLSPFRIENVDIDGGASSIKLKLGGRYNNTHVNIDAGATKIRIKVPEASACEIQTHTFLSGRELDGFNKIKDGLYQTPNFSDSVNQIIIDVEAAVSGIAVERY